MTDSIPRYPASSGPRKAKQLAASRARYRAAIEELQEELDRNEAEFARAFEKQDAQQTTQARIDQLAGRATKRLHT